MKLTATRYAETLGGDPAGRRNLTLGVIQHLWRSPVPFVGFYAPEGVRLTERRSYTPAPPRLVDDTEYLVGIEAHKKTFAAEIAGAMIPSGSLRGYFEVPTDEGWKFHLDLVGRRLETTDPWGLRTESDLAGDVAPFVWAFKNCGFCLVTLYDKDIEAVRDDLLFVAKREGVVLDWRAKVA
ncbi:hypothetical protein [Rubrobacter radiotolerans]|nr:hypothetical protein [Rubrobacter radiotolerans]MDX5893445.1 hypothetical protein [Rubrobacter radiotolerans]SMC03750.1 conserved hypothetical protein [Rubrobacter radiotolerans DSM 5868]